MKTTPRQGTEKYDSGQARGRFAVVPGINHSLPVKMSVSRVFDVLHRRSAGRHDSTAGGRTGTSRRSVFCWSFFLSLLLFHPAHVAEASMFQASFAVLAGRKKCIGQDLLRHVLSLVEITSKTGQNLAVTVLEDQIPIIFEGKKPTIKTAFTAQRDATHWICILNESPSADTEVSFSFKSGASARDYSQVAKREHLQPVQVRLRMIEDELSSYQENLIRMRQTEDALRAVNDNTGVRVIVFCVLNLVLMIILGGWQMISTKAFFREKKII
ncbi:unnamed protein product [Amoebophrya sp. A120]|nr:unnamed protein product [Amoebophrya sp. A120]|eukprot:GSA120T00011016001.1